MVKSVLLMSAVASLFTACAPHAPSQLAPTAKSATGIIGGQLAKPTDFPAHSTVLLLGRSLSKTEDRLWQCSGVVIASDLVATAAHCVADLGFSKASKGNTNAMSVIYKTSFGSSQVADLVEGGLIDVIEKANIRLSPDYDADSGEEAGEALQSDWALIKLNEPLPESYMPVAILKDASLLKENGTVIAAGYGPPTMDSTTGPHILNIIYGYAPADPAKPTFSLREVPLQITNVLSLPRREMTTQTLYTGPNDTGVTVRKISHGDSGGPVYIRTGNQILVIGVTASGGNYGSNFERFLDSFKQLKALAADLGSSAHL